MRIAIAIACALLIATCMPHAQAASDLDRPLGGGRSATAPFTWPSQAPAIDARPTRRPIQPAQPHSYQREYPREYPPLNPPAFRKGDKPGEWRD